MYIKNTLIHWDFHFFIVIRNACAARWSRSQLRLGHQSPELLVPQDWSRTMGDERWLGCHEGEVGVLPDGERGLVQVIHPPKTLVPRGEMICEIVQRH